MTINCCDQQPKLVSVGTAIGHDAAFSVECQKCKRTYTVLVDCPESEPRSLAAFRKRLEGK